MKRMTDRAEIERLLNQTGRTLEGLPTQDDYWYSDDYVDRNKEIGMMMYRSGFILNEPYIMHQSDVIELLVGALRDALDKRTKWISVEERLPEYKTAVLGYGLRYRNYPDTDPFPAVHVVYSRGEDEGWFTFWNNEYVAVTHWMPLPEPPKEDEE